MAWTTLGGRLAIGGAVLAMTSWPAGMVQGQPPRPGDVQKVQVVTLSMQVGSTEKENRQVTYAPPPGWFVRSHTVVCKHKHGNSSFAVNTVPQNWNWLSEEQVKESYRALIDVAGKSNAAELQAKCTLEQEALLQTIRRVRATHHALVVEATARGEGFLRGGGGIDLTVTAELVYVGTEETLRKTTAQHREKLK